MASTLQSHPSGLFLSNSIAAVAAKCRDSLLQCTNIPTLMQLEWAENRLAEFKLWTATTGALAGDAASLDARLITEPDTKDLVNGLLVLLAHCLEKCKRFALPSDEETEEVTENLDELDTATDDADEWWANDVQGMDSARRLDAARDIPRGFSPWSDDSSSHPGSGSLSVAEDTSALLEVEAEVEQIINHLARVALAIRKSGTSSRLHKADRTFDPSNHQKLRRHLELVILARGREDGSSDYHIDREALTAIQERLILANLRRRNRYRYAQKHADKLAVDSASTNNAGAKSTAVDILTLRQNDSALRAPQIAESKRGQSHGQEKDRLPHRSQGLTATSASGVAQAMEAVPKQILTPSRVAKTNITATAARVLYPKPPKSKMLQYFKCPCCFQMLPDMYREKTLWKKHMMADICPYICILEECPTPEKLYVMRHEWTEHIEKSHRQCWQCPACSTLGRPPVIFPSVEIFIHHLRKTHSGSINEEQYSTIVTEAARPIPPGIYRCPLCDSTGPADSPDLLDHIAEHLHNFALRSLPWPNDEPGDNDTRDSGDPYFNANNYFDLESENDSAQDVSIDSDRDSDGLTPLSANSSHDDSVHETLTEASPIDGEETQRMDQMRHWLSPADTSSSLDAARSQRHKGTGVWFLNNEDFVHWKSGGKGFLWLDGIPGSGKTILSTTVFDHLEDIGSGCTLAFFFDFMDIGKQTFDCLLRSLAWQLYRSVAASRGELESLHTFCHDGATQPYISRLAVCVESMIQSSEGLSVIIDALDECATGQTLLLWLESIVLNPSFDNIKLMVTGGRQLHLSESFSGLRRNRYIVSMRLHTSNDIMSYVNARLEQDVGFTMKQIPQDLLGEIRTRLRDESEGSFLWAVIQLDTLAACQSLAAMKASLQSLPRDLLETYRGIIRRLNPDYRNDVIRLLQFLTYTEQPLTSSEAIEILATQLDTDPPHFNVEKRLFRDEDLLQYCPSLLSLIAPSPHRRESRKVRLSHKTVKDFLLCEGAQFEPKSASIAITRTALIYIRDIDIQDTLKEVSARFPLAERAAQVVVALARDTEADDDVFSEISSFLLDSIALDRLCRLSQISIGDHQVSPLFIACKLGLQRVTRRLLEDGVDANEGSGTHHGALFVASQEGHSEVLQLLLEHGADVSAGDGTSWSPLQAASENGHQDIVRVLLAARVDVHAYTQEASSPVTLASLRGHTEVMRLLVDSGPAANGYALYEASRKGHVGVVELLLDEDPALLNHQSYMENSALRAALEGGHDRVIEILRSHILCQAVIAGDYGTVEALLDEGASPDERSCLGTPLKIAAQNKNESIVKLLLQKGADVSIAADGDDLVGYYAGSLGLKTSKEILHLLCEHHTSGLSGDELYDFLKISGSLDRDLT
ncbi:Pfs NACHT and Ankyrin domain protein [Colletotrichum asianum]